MTTQTSQGPASKHTLEPSYSSSRTSLPSPRPSNTNAQRPFAAYLPAVDVTAGSTSVSRSATPAGLPSPTYTYTSTVNSIPNSHFKMEKDKSKKRKSWFKRGKNKPPSTLDQARTPNSIPEDSVAPPSSWQSPEDRLRPIQFAPNRIQTLYVTKSERDLYLAAMSQLDQSPPPLPLWTDPAPALPRLNPSQPLPPLVIPNGSVSSGHARSMSEGTGYHPLTSRPLSPKLVTSPQMGRSGLLVRDEFRKAPAPKLARHALMALTPPASLRLTGFPINVIGAIDMVIQENWGQGISTRSEGAETLKSKPEGETFTWRVELEGKAWKRKGSEELDSIRLLLSIFSVLAIHGWTMVESIQAGGSKKDAHNLLFSYSHETTLAPPLYFALSIPLPDRLSLISAPAKSTPAIISALREAIVFNWSRSAHIGTRTANTGVTASTDSKSSERGAGLKSKAPKVQWRGFDPRGIKLEGWVHDGVYRFWIDGMRRWLGGTVKRRLVESLHPSLLIATEIHDKFGTIFESGIGRKKLVAKGRDILFFSSLPASGLSVRDTYVPRAPSEAGTESPVLVSSAASLPAQEYLDAQEVGGIPRDVDPANRQLPWTSVLNEQNNVSSSSDRSVPPAFNRIRNAPSALRSDQPGSRRRTPSQDSTKPLLRATAPSPVAGNSAQSTPKHKNVLLKKNSLQRHRSASGNHSRQPSENGRNLSSAQGHHTAPAATNSQPQELLPPHVRAQEVSAPDDGSTRNGVYGQEDNHRHFIVTNPDRDSDSRLDQAGARDGGEWSFVDPPANVGKLGVTMFDTAGQTHGSAPPSPPKGRYEIPGRISGAETAESGGSIYADAQAHHDHHPQQYHQHRYQNSVPNDFPAEDHRTLPETEGPLASGLTDYRSDPSSRTYLADGPDSDLGTDLGAGSELNHAHPLNQPLALGQPIDQRGWDQPIMQPVIKDDSPQRRARHGQVEMSVNSVHGSVGYLASMLSGRSRGSVDGGRGSVDMDRLPMSGNGSASVNANAGESDAAQRMDHERDEFHVPEPAIRIIPSSTQGPARTAGPHVGAKSGNPIPPPVPARPGQGATPNRPGAQAETPLNHETEVANGNRSDQGTNKHAQWDKKGKVKEGMRRVWDEDTARWRDVPNVTGNGVGSARTKVTLH